VVVAVAAVRTPLRQRTRPPHSTQLQHSMRPRHSSAAAQAAASAPAARRRIVDPAARLKTAADRVRAEVAEPGRWAGTEPDRQAATPGTEADKWAATEPDRRRVGTEAVRPQVGTEADRRQAGTEVDKPRAGIEAVKQRVEIEAVKRLATAAEEPLPTISPRVRQPVPLRAALAFPRARMDRFAPSTPRVE